MVELEVVGTHTATGVPCRPSGDYFQLWVGGNGASGKDGSIQAVRTTEEGVFAVRLPRAGKWTVSGLWVMDGPSREIVTQSSKVGQWFGEGVPHDVFGPGKAAWHVQAKRDALGGTKDSTLVRWEDQALPSLTMVVTEPLTPLPKLEPCRLEQMYAATMEGLFDFGNNGWQPLACELSTSISRIPSKAKILLAGDSTTHRAFNQLKKRVGDCTAATGKTSQAKKYPGGDAGIRAGAGVHYKCARGIELWFHAFTKADEEQVGPTGGMKNPMAKMRKIDQFDFSYVGTALDLVILTIGVHFSYYDPDKFAHILEKFLPAIKSATAESKEHWFMPQNRYCGPCFSTGRGFSSGNKPVYLREVQNEARGEIMADISMAKAIEHGWRPMNQHAISRSIPVGKQEDGVHCKLAATRR
jgi:hypothetical protein